MGVVTDGVLMSIEHHQAKDKLIALLIERGYANIADRYSQLLHELFVNHPLRPIESLNNAYKM